MSAATEKSGRPRAGFSQWLEKLLGFTILCALVYFGYRYLTTEQLNEQIRQRVEAKFRQRYAGLLVHLEGARRIEGQGIELRGLTIAEADRSREPMLKIDRILARCNTALPEFVTQPVVVESILIDRAHMRATRRDGNFWNVQHLFPLPVSPHHTPPVRIENATIEVRDAAASPESEPLIMREIQLTVTPDAAAAEALGLPPEMAAEGVRVEARFAGDYLRSVQLEGFATRKMERWQLRGAGDDLRLSRRLLAALPPDIAARAEPIAGLSGHAQVRFEVDNLVPADQPWRFALVGQLDQGRFADARLPQALTDVSARVRGDNSGLFVDDLQARLGDARIQASLQFEGYTRGSPLVARLDLEEFPLDEDFAALIPPTMHPFWNDLGMRGTLRGKVTLQFDGRRWTPQIDGEIRGASLRYVKFPYRLTSGEATVNLQHDLLTIRGQALAGNAKVLCTAEIRQPGPEWSGWAEARTTEVIPLDDRLLEALPAKTQQVVRSMHARGSVQLLGRLDRRAGRTHHHIEVHLHDCSVEYEKFRYPIDHVYGTLRDSDGVWSFLDLRGTQGTAHITCSGNYGPDTTGEPLLALDFHAANVALNETLRGALEAAQQKLWDDFRLRGELDVLAAEMRFRPTTNTMELGVTGQKLFRPDMPARPVRVEPSWFPFAIDIASGKVEYRDGVVKLHNLRGVHDRTRLEADGTFRWDRDGAWTLTLPRLSADRLQLDHDLLAALPVDLGRALAKARFQGALAMSGALEMGSTAIPMSTVAAPVVAAASVPPAAPLQARWDLQFDVEDGRLAGDVPVEHIHGGVRLSGGVEGGEWSSSGDLELDSAFVRDVQFTQVRGPFFVNQREVLLGAWASRQDATNPPRKLLAQVFDGLLATDAAIELDDTGAFRLECSLEQADLGKIAAETHLRTSDISGKAYGIVQITGNTRGKHTWRGGGNVRLRDAYLYKVPVMVSLLKLLSVRTPDSTAFTTSDIDFRVQGDDLIFDRLDLGGDAVSLKGRGRLYEQKQVDLLFYTQVGRYDARLLRPVLAEASPLFLLIEVSGTLDQPQMKKTAFPAINETLRELFPDLAREPALTAGSPKSRLRDFVPLPEMSPATGAKP